MSSTIFRQKERDSATTSTIQYVCTQLFYVEVSYAETTFKSLSINFEMAHYGLQITWCIPSAQYRPIEIRERRHIHWTTMANHTMVYTMQQGSENKYSGHDVEYMLMVMEK
jgi:hypothetical protein